MAAPEIKTQPKSTSAKEGKKATFTIKAKGKNLKYQWYVKKYGSDKWTPIKGKTSNKLTLKMVGKGDDKNQYRCVVSNEGGSATSHAAKLTVYYKPEIITQPKKTTVKAGKQVTFKIKAAGNGLTYQWYRRKPGGKDWVAIAGAKKASYTFKATKKLNGYSYRCRVKNKAGTTDTKAAMLKVK